ncbi:MAG: efflux RND transporter permease subunit [Hyphomicrobiaceae bacterium]|nr:efflux RND transporter permease subunit [Hyphomicrobiaceae bacterium]
MADREYEEIGPGESTDLGMAGKITRTFIHSPLTPLLLVACLALGVLGMYITPRQEDPQISVPMVDIFFKFPGASAEQVASLATDPLERMMSEIEGVKHVYSASQRGQGMVTVQFIVGEKMGPSLVKLKDKLDTNLDKIPPGVSRPMVKSKGVDDVPTVTLTLWSKAVDDAALRLIGLEVMQRLKEVPNTSQNFLVGGRSEEIRIEVQPQLLRGYGIGIGQIAKVIQSANQKKNVGTSETGASIYSVYTGDFLRNKSDVERLVVGTSRGAPVYVRDIAKVIEGPGDAKSIVQYFSGPGIHFEPDCGMFCSIKRSVFGYEKPKERPFAHGDSAVTIAIAKKGGTNGVSVSQAILAKVEFLKGRVIPDNVHVEVTRDYGKSANDKVNTLLGDMGKATLMVTILIFVFLGLRPTFVVATVIPVIILITVFGAWMLDFTVDRVSLFALIFCIGILVDDATVVVENIYRRWLLKGGVDTATTIDAVREVGNPTILATLAIIAALLPMGMVSGMMGPYMMPIPVLGSVAMTFSLFAAFIFTPWLAIRVRPSLRQLNAMQDKEHKTSQMFDRFFRSVLGPLIDNPGRARWFTRAVWGVFMLACSMFYFQGVAVKMMPLDNKPEFNIVVNMPEGTALPVTANVAQQLTDTLLQAKGSDGKASFPEVIAIQTYSGTASPFNFNGLVRHYYLRQNPWEGDIQIQLLDKEERARSSHEIAEAARAILTPIAKKLGAKIQIVEMPPGPPVLQSMVAEIYGPDDATRKAVVKKVTEAFEAAPSVVDVDNYVPAPYNAYVFVVDRQKAESNGVSMSDITSQLSMVMGGFKLGDVKRGRELEPRYIVLQAPLAVRSQITRLGELPIQTQSGKMIPLAALGRFEKQPQDRVIFHKDLRNVEYVTGEMTGVVTGLAAPIYGMLEVQKYLKDYVPPGNKEGLWPGYFGPPANSFQSNYEWGGEWTVTFETFRDMGGAFMVALILIYMLVVMEFGNYRLPGIIMAPIPLTLIGIIPGHWLLGAEFTATSMIGWIALAGIIVRNSILLVDFSKHQVEKGVPLREAVIQAVVTRTRPILITQLTMIAGAFSIIHDPIFQGMAISLMFGAMVSTVLTLFIIPLACVKAPGAYELPADAVDARVADALAVEAGGGAAVMGGSGASGKSSGKAAGAGILTTISALFVAVGKGMGHPLENIVAIPYMIWQFLAQLIQFGSAKSDSRGGQGVASGRSAAGAFGTPATVVASQEGRPGKLVKSAIDEEIIEESETATRSVERALDEAENKAQKSAKKKAKKAKKAQKEAKKAAKEKLKADKVNKNKAKEKLKSNGKGNGKDQIAKSSKADKNGVTAGEKKKVKSLKTKADQSNIEKNGVIEGNGELPHDDLKEVNGIGPKLERALNKQGIMTFSQLSELDVGLIAEAENETIDLAGRIEREDWIGQARKLMKKEEEKNKNKNK